jgi:hypothetical protein
MVDAAHFAVATHRPFDVIDFQSIGLAHLAIIGMRSAQRLVPAPLAFVLIAALCGSSRKRPPMIIPKGIPAFIAAPGATTCGQFRPAPRAFSFAQAMRDDARREK